MNKAVFLDKDGTLVDNSEYPYVIPADKILVSQVVKGLLHLQRNGYKLIIISNQGWIAKGRLTKERAEEIFRSVIEQLGSKGVFINDYDYCPHARKENCQCKKPRTLMIDTMIKEHNLDKSKCLMIGDMAGDIAAGKNSGITTVLVKTGCGKDYSSELIPDHTIKNLNCIHEVLDGRKIK